MKFKDFKCTQCGKLFKKGENTVMIDSNMTAVHDNCLQDHLCEFHMVSWIPAEESFDIIKKNI